jgi:nucleotide-binding universal stress UspA family protein
MRPPTLRTVVLATDGSRDSLGARRAVADIARATHAAVHVVGVWHFVPHGLPSVLHEDADAIVDAESRALEAAGVRSVRRHVRCGDIAKSILRVAQDVDADLVVVGNGGHGPLGRLILGSVSDAVVHGSTRPVLVVRGGEGSWPPDRLVVGHDGSAEAAAAARLATLLARCAGARLIIVDVVSTTSHHAIGDRRLELDAQLVDRFGAIPGSTDVRLLTEGAPPAATLMGLAAGTPPAAIAVGRRGMGRLREMAAGSVSTRLVHAAPGAVLVVPPGGAEGC